MEATVSDDGAIEGKVRSEDSETRSRYGAGPHVGQTCFCRGKEEINSPKSKHSGTVHVVPSAKRTSTLPLNALKGPSDSA
jgi:hypothetical protein